MKKLIWLILLLPILLTGSKQKEQWHYELPFRAFDLNDSIPTINQFGQIRNGIIVDAIVTACNADPSGVKLTKVELDYIRALVGGMYVIGTWQKCATVYGFVGGNAFKHKFNWKTIGTYDLVYSGNFIHSSTGTLPNQPNAYANTNLLASSLNSNSLHLSYYSRTNLASSIDRREMGAEINPYVSPGSYAELVIRRQSDQSFSLIGNDNTFALTTNTDSRGYYIANRSSASSNSLFKNGIVTVFNSTIGANTLPNSYMLLFAANFSNTTTLNPFGGTNLECAFASIGSGFTNAQAIQQSRIVTYAQTILGRQ
jgi:hypothetical protein